MVIATDTHARQMLVDVLASIGLPARSFSDSSAALGELGNDIPVLVILDSADDSSCRDMCRSMFSRDAFSNVAYIMLAIDNDRQSLNDDFEAGATNVFVKPCTAEFLRNRLRMYGTDAQRTNSGGSNAEQLQTATQELPDITFEIDAKGHVHKCIAGAENGGPLKPSDMCGRRLAECLSAEAELLLSAKIRGALKSRKDAELDLTIGANDDARHYNVRLIVRGRRRLLAIFRELDSVGGRPILQAHRICDTLTRLTTRELFLAEVDASIADARLKEGRLAVVSVDLDRFTKINDTLGRGAGDIVLRECADRLRKCLAGIPLANSQASNTAEVPIARMAGDEFICLLNNVDSREEVEAIADKIRAAFDEPVTVSGAALAVTPSIGIALFPSDGNDAEALCGNARTALDEARFQGIDGRAFFTDTLKFRSLKRPDLIKELGWAIEKDQLELHYLPRIDLKSGNVTGLEALLRWIHPLRGSVPLSDVIPLAEVSGLMRPLGEWILNTACAEASGWEGARENSPGVSINLSADEFARDDLPELVKNALVANGLGSSRLQFEMPEKLLVRYRRSLKQLRELQALGTEIIIDDFGVGHSSLSLLSQLPINAIKIDRSFVEGADRGGDQSAVCAAIIAMAHELGISVIAEGVETDEQLDFLLNKGCDAAQGFLYSRPLPGDEVLSFLDAYDAQFGASTINKMQQALAQVS